MEHGYHLLLTGTLERPLRFAEVHDFLSGCTSHIGMAALGEPVVSLGRSGMVGFQMIAESHISLHEYESEPMVFIDIFSCKEFDPTRALAFVSSALPVGGFIEEHLVRRGIED